MGKYSLLFSAIHIVRCYSIFCTTRWYSIVHNSTVLYLVVLFWKSLYSVLQCIVDSGCVVSAIYTVFVVCTVYAKCVGWSVGTVCVVFVVCVVGSEYAVWVVGAVSVYSVYTVCIV